MNVANVAMDRCLWLEERLRIMKEKDLRAGILLDRMPNVEALIEQLSSIRLVIFKGR